MQVVYSCQRLPLREAKNMSSVNIHGVVHNMSKSTSIYTPIVEAIVNSIQSIEKNKSENGEIVVTLIRDSQSGLKFDADALEGIESVLIEDNGEGFTEENTGSFDMLYSNQKIDIGGKGFGRFTYLRYFETVDVESVFIESGKTYRRTFDFVLNDAQEIVSNNQNTEIDNASEKKTLISLNSIKRGQMDKKLSTIAKKLLEKLLIYFINDSYNCPTITLKCDQDSIVLNTLLGEDYAEIQKIESNSFTLQSGEQKETFDVKIFKIFFPGNQKSKICLTAHNREVTEVLTHTYVPEFIDNFFDKSEGGITKDYLIKTYVIGNYLDKNVSLERNGFSIPKSVPDMYSIFTQMDIERNAAELTRNSKVFSDEILFRQQKKMDKINKYVESNAPWYKEFVSEIDVETVPFQLDDKTIDAELSKIKFQYDQDVKHSVKKIFDGESENLNDEVNEVVKKISKSKLTELAHYVSLRKAIIDLFKKSLDIKDDGKYQLEDTVHSIIFPTKSNSEKTMYNDHNLWLIDERLNFSDFISSDQRHIVESKDRSDIVVYNRKIAFRTDNEASNPITIFEFKRPQRDDFVDDPNEDPVLQVLKYVKQIRSGSLKTPVGRDIYVDQNTPFYSYIVCDLTKKVKEWLHSEKNFKMMPDGKGWYYWYENVNLYMEVVSWDKVWQDAEMRNKVFFHKLGIE